MTVGVNDNWYTCWNGCPSNPCNVCIRLRSCCPDANGVGFTRDTSVTYRDIVVADGVMRNAAEPNSDIVVAVNEARERISADGRVALANGVARERISADGYV